MSAERNLIFGILALQLDFIKQDELVTGIHQWLLAKQKPLGLILVEQGALKLERRTLLDGLVAEHVAQHDGDAQKSLAALSLLDSVCAKLAEIPDGDVQASLRTIASAGDDDLSATRSQDTIGDSTASGVRFRILRPHAKGGIGQVFIAEDSELHREVALKEILDQHADNLVSRSRFVLEAEITGGLEHPGIVPVYGLGTYADGRPFYAMRFIRGDSLKDAIAQFHNSHGPAAQARVNSKPLLAPRAPRFESLEFRQLLGRFIDVCQAIAYAHSRRVLHRDLKPGNIMLGKYGETLVVDWGLAKPLGQSDEPATLDREPALQPSSASGSSETLPGLAVGTPQFMSPEQASGRTDLIGPASDIYGLGATLYMLLTGKPPIANDDLLEMLRNVDRGNFAPPSSVLSTVPAALEAVCLKAMALMPHDRYRSAQDMAADLEHWLADEPVTAWREPMTVRAGRWMRKHRTTVTTAAALLLSTAIAFAALYAQSERARHQIATQRDLAEASEQLAQKERDRADEEKRVAQAVLEFVEKRVFAAARPERLKGGLGHQVPLRKAIEAALPFVDESFANQPLVQARLRTTMGISFWYLGDVKIAAEQFLAARALYSRHSPDHPGTLSNMNNLALCYADFGRYVDAHKLREEAWALQKIKLGSDHPDTLMSMNNLANSYMDLGRHEEALKLHEETLAIRKSKLGPDHPDTLMSMANIANSYTNMGRHADALRLYEESLAIRKSELGPDHPHTINSMNNLAISYARLGRHEDALQLSTETLALRKAKLGPDHPDTLATMMNLANSHSVLGRHTNARKLHEEALELKKAKLGLDHPETLRSMYNLAAVYAALGQHVDAFKLREQTLALRRAKLGSDHPETLRSLSNVATSLVALDRGAEAVRMIDESLKLAAGRAADPLFVPTVIDLRLRHFKTCGDADGCRATAEMWDALNRTDAESLFNSACLRAVTAAVIENETGPDATRLAKIEADRAMDWLNRAVAAGYADAARVKKDNDLNALHNRDDFKKLVADLEAMAKVPEKKP